MKKLMLSALTLSVALYATGCGTNQDLAIVQQALQPALRQNPNTIQTMSNQTLSAVSKRLKLMVFQMLDANKDGFVSQQEFSYASASPMGFEKIDKNKDGKISFREAESKEFGMAFGTTPAILRETARYSWKYINRNNDTFITLDEMLQTLASQPAPCCPGSAPGYPTPIVTPSAVPSAGYGTGYGSYPGNPYGYPMDEYSLRQLKVELTQTFNLSDKNLDQRLTFSEFEDLFALRMVSERETPYPSYPYPQPPSSAVPGYPDPVVTSSPYQPSPYPTASATSDVRRR